jgi:hypothetical protein
MTLSGDARLPAQIGRYQIRSLIGRGGMGQVYGAFDPSLDRLVALKTIVAGSDNPQFVERLQREARACGRLHHPGIVTIHDLGEADGTVFIAMEWLQGKNLADALESGGLTFEAKLNAMVEILDALAYAHSEGIIHRDIKPSNVWVLPNGRMKLLDFGLARLAQVDALTMPGEVMGTPHYMSPEQLMGQTVDPRTDVFSTGVLGYELFAHKRAFDGESITAVILQVLQQPPPPIDSAWVAAFPEVQAILLKAMAKSPDERYGSAQAMADAFRQFLDARKADIRRVDAELSNESADVVARAQTLTAAGQKTEATQLLTEALRRNPDATAIREILNGPTVVLPPRELPPQVGGPAATGPAMYRAPAHVASAATTRTAQQPTGQAQGWSGPALGGPGLSPSRDPGLHESGRLETSGGPGLQQPRPPTRPVWIFVAAAAVLLLAGGAAAYFMVYSPSQPTAGPQNAQAQTAGVVSPPPPGPGSSDSSGATGGGGTATPPGPSGGSGGGAAGSTQSGAAQTAGAAAPVSAASGFFVTESTPGAVRQLLVQQLEQSGLTRRERQQDALWIVSATAEIETRPAMAGTSALTADYAGTVEVRRRGGASSSQSFDGHAMEFGAPVVRAKAARELAQKMAEYVKTVVK